MKWNLFTEEDVSSLQSKLDVILQKLDAIDTCWMAPEIYTINDVCETNLVSKYALRKSRDEGMISFSKVGDKIFFQKSDFDDFFLDVERGFSHRKED